MGENNSDMTGAQIRSIKENLKNAEGKIVSKLFLTIHYKNLS